MNQAPHEDAERDEAVNEELEDLTRTLEILNLREREIRRRSFNIQQRIQTIQQAQRRGNAAVLPAPTPWRQRRDRHNKVIDVGDYVNFLTTGRNNTRSGTITQISHRRFVSARDRTGRIINREPSNVEIVRKYNSDNDQRRRYE